MWNGAMSQLVPIKITVLGVCKLSIDGVTYNPANYLQTGHLPNCRFHISDNIYGWISPSGVPKLGYVISPEMWAIYDLPVELATAIPFGLCTECGARATGTGCAYPTRHKL